MRAFGGLISAFALVLLTACASTPRPEAPLAEPPADAQVWSVFSTAGRHGQESVWTDAQGRRWARLTYELRGFATDVEQMIVLDSAGRPTELVIRGTTPQGDATETFQFRDGRAAWRSAVDQGDVNEGGFYLPFNGPNDSFIVLAQALMAAPDHEVDLLPSGRARIDQLTQATVRNEAGEQRRFTAWTISGLAWYPTVIWFDADQFFGASGFINYAPAGWESVIAELGRLEGEALAARGVALARDFGQRPGEPIVFRDVRLYDAEDLSFRDHQSVVVRDGRIAAVGARDEIVVPAGARIIEGAGRTLTPGLWDNHMHLLDDTSAALLLANGITTIRDPANNPPDIEDRIRRIEARQLLGPRVFPSLLIDGPGPRAAQMARLATTEAEALQHVRYAHEHGYIGVKIYGSLDPALVAPIAREAHRLGLRVSGHIPAGMRPHQAIEAGYDELTHFYFTLMEVMPDDVVAQSNGLMRLFGPARHGADIDFNSPPMSTLMDEMARRGVVADPTINLIERLLLPEAGRLPLAYAPFEGAMPPQIERGFRGGALTPPEGLSRERIQQSADHMLAAIPELHRRGVTIIAGTDGVGLELVRELELYVQAGLPPAQALATATIAPARVMRIDEETGSIAVGKRAELILVDGDPEAEMGALRRVEWVMRDGMLINAGDLRRALGLGEVRR